MDELARELGELRRLNERRLNEPHKRRSRRQFSRRRFLRRRFSLIIGAAMTVIVLALLIDGSFGGADSFAPPTGAALAGLSVGGRIVAIANSQVGYATNPSDSYCNKFSAYWSAGTGNCPSGETSEEWCADFAAWVWRKAGVRFTYGYGPGEINAGAISFYEWGLANGRWHPTTGGYKASVGDVAVYGVSLDGAPSATHVSIVTDDPPGHRGPDVINGDGDRAGPSVVETGSDEVQADAGHHQHGALAGYVSPPSTDHMVRAL